MAVADEKPLEYTVFVVGRADGMSRLSSETGGEDGPVDHDGEPLDPDGLRKDDDDAEDDGQEAREGLRGGLSR